VTTARDKNIPVELIDRDINVTLQRTWANPGLWKRPMPPSSPPTASLPKPTFSLNPSPSIAKSPHA